MNIVNWPSVWSSSTVEASDEFIPGFRLKEYVRWRVGIVVIPKSLFPNAIVQPSQLDESNGRQTHQRSKGVMTRNIGACRFSVFFRRGMYHGITSLK